MAGCVCCKGMHGEAAPAAALFRFRLWQTAFARVMASWGIRLQTPQGGGYTAAAAVATRPAPKTLDHVHSTATCTAHCVSAQAGLLGDVWEKPKVRPSWRTPLWFTVQYQPTNMEFGPAGTVRCTSGGHACYTLRECESPSPETAGRTCAAHRRRRRCHCAMLRVAPRCPCGVPSSRGRPPPAPRAATSCVLPSPANPQGGPHRGRFSPSSTRHQRQGGAPAGRAAAPLLLPSPACRPRQDAQ